MATIKPDGIKILSNFTSFLDLIPVGEIPASLAGAPTFGYNVCAGSTPAKPILFSSYATHPRIRCDALNSDAAGRYQLLGRYYLPYATQLKLKDFSPLSQDLIALQQMREKRVTDALAIGDFETAVRRAGTIWASLPESPYGQRTITWDTARAAFLAAGGVIA